MDKIIKKWVDRLSAELIVLFLSSIALSFLATKTGDKDPFSHRAIPCVPVLILATLLYVRAWASVRDADDVFRKIRHSMAGAGILLGACILVAIMLSPWYGIHHVLLGAASVAGIMHLRFFMKDHPLPIEEEEVEEE